MDFDVLAVAANAVRPPPPVRNGTAAGVGDSAVAAVAALRRTPVAAPPPPRRVELSFHEDLRVLITKLIDEQTGETVVQTPARQVLAMVADVMKQIRTNEEG